MTKEEKFEAYDRLTKELLEPETQENMDHEDAVLEVLDDIWYSLSQEEVKELKERIRVDRPGGMKCKR